MAKIVSLQRRRNDFSADADTKKLSEISTQVHELETLSNKVELILSNMAENEPIPHAVALAAGRYAAMKLTQSHGRAYAMSFFDDCIATAEICEDILNEMGEEYSSS